MSTESKQPSITDLVEKLIDKAIFLTNYSSDPKEEAEFEAARKTLLEKFESDLKEARLQSSAADSKELRSLCTRRDEARRERDELRAQVAVLRSTIQNDAWACAFQSMGQYRSALLKALEPPTYLGLEEMHYERMRFQSFWDSYEAEAPDNLPQTAWRIWQEALRQRTPAPTQLTAELWLRSRYGAYRGHSEWRALEEAFNAGMAAQKGGE